jgi:hypothetical protein
MVVDNADDAAVMFESRYRETGITTTAPRRAHSLSNYLPLSSQGSIVITSRTREVVENLQVYREDILDVEKMEVKVAKTLLVKKLNKAVRGTNPRDLECLVKCLECMPLAITQAAVYIEQAAPRMTVSRYLQILEESDGELTTLL